MKISESIIEQMYRADWEARGAGQGLFSWEDNKKLGAYSVNMKGMTAAAEVLAEKLLGKVTDEEWGWCGDIDTATVTRSTVSAILHRRYRLIEAEPTLEEKVFQLLINSGPDNPDGYKNVAVDIVKLLEKVQ